MKTIALNAQQNMDKRQRALQRAHELFPDEVWLEVSPGVHLAASRRPKSDEQIRTLEKELEHAQIIAADGHTVYLLPEQGPRSVKHPDAVVDGLIMEFKTITGNIRKIAENFKAAREKADNVFLNIIPRYSKDIIQRKLKGTIIKKGYQDGLIIVHLNDAGKTYYWNVDDLK
jgi:hypothetical protein